MAIVFIAGLICLSIAEADEPTRIRWNFIQGKQYIYDYEQQIVATTDNIKEKGRESILKAGGTIRVICLADDARLSLWIKMKEGILGGKSLTNEQLDKMSPMSVEFPLLPDGTIKQGRYGAGGNMQLLVDLLFPLPHEPLIPGRSIKQDMIMFASGMPHLTGKAEFTYIGLETVNELRCVKYHVSWLASSEPKPGQEGRATATMNAEIDCVFAFEVGYFVSVNSVSKLNIQTSAPGEDEAMKLIMVQNHTKSLYLREVEDVS